LAIELRSGISKELYAAFLIAAMFCIPKLAALPLLRAMADLDN